MAERDRVVSVAFGRRLRELRAKRGVSQDGLARRTGVHQSAIARFERAEREPRLTTVLRLARGLGVNPGGLLEGPDDEAGGVTVERDGADLDPDTARIAFGLRLRQVRRERGLSQDNLAERTEVHPVAVSRMERGLREPRGSTILRLAGGVGVKPGALVDGLRVEKPDDAAPGGEA